MVAQCHLAKTIICIILLPKCFIFCSKNVLTDYESWKKHQLRQKIESGKYFRKSLEKESILQKQVKEFTNGLENGGLK